MRKKWQLALIAESAKKKEWLKREERTDKAVATSESSEAADASQLDTGKFFREKEENSHLV